MNQIKNKSSVGKIFSELSLKYDFLNLLFSFGLHYFWKKKAVDFLDLKKDDIVADLACGTADIAIMAARRAGKVYAVDFNDEMLVLAEKKIKAKNIGNIEIIKSDISKLDFSDNFFDKIIVGFGLRNVESAEKVLVEINRVLKSGGKLVILDFFKPRNRLAIFFYKFYLKNIIPFIAGFFLKSAKAIYGYLFDSIENFYLLEDLIKIAGRIGFNEINFKKSAGGCVGIILFQKAIKK